MWRDRCRALSFLLTIGAMLFLVTPMAFAGEADINLPDLSNVTFSVFGYLVSGLTLMYWGFLVCVIGAIFGLIQYKQTKNLSAHKSMLEVSETIWQTCKTYLLQQGKFLLAVWILIAICMVYYFKGLEGSPMTSVLIILGCSVLGILGSYLVAWFGIRINTVANSRSAFASLRGIPYNVVGIPLKSGMSVGLLLVSWELFFMIGILVYVPKELVGPAFIGFGIGESLGASVLRICGGIFTKIADLGSDLMKIILHLPEDDPRNPGVVADCTGDNAGDSVGPTADGFETYGVTGVALIAFLALALFTQPVICGQLIIWIFVMRIIMILTSLIAYFVNARISKALYSKKKEFNYEGPLTNLVWLTSVISIILTFVTSYILLSELPSQYSSLWWALSVIISCGTFAAALIPELTKVFTSTNARHLKEIVTASRQGGAPLNILSGLVCGNFSAFWEGLAILILMLIAYLVSKNPSMVAIMPPEFVFAAPVLAFGLVAFGFLGMGPVTIAVDSFGPVADNAQSIYELSRIKNLPNIKEEIKKDFGFEPDFENSKRYLESADGAGNTFKATAKPVLVGTAVVGATTLIFGIIILLEHLFGDVIARLSLVQPEIVLGLLAGGGVIYWFSGASMQAVVAGSYQAVVFIKKHINLDTERSSVKDSREVVRICTMYAQKGMINIFVVVFFMALALAFFNPYYFIGYLIAIAFFGLFQAIYMANAGGAWDNAKKIVEVDLREEGTSLHETVVVGDTVGDPYKDTTAVSFNPVIKFTTLFGLLAVQIAVTIQSSTLRWTLGSIFFVISIIFIYRSFYNMRISEEEL